MPNQCVRCGTLYNDDAKELLSGCSCGGKFFFYMKKKDVEEVKVRHIKHLKDNKD